METIYGSEYIGIESLSSTEIDELNAKAELDANFSIESVISCNLKV